MSKQLSASSVGHALRGCAYPFVPTTPTTPRPSGAAAAMGSDVHLAVETALAGRTMVWGEQPQPHAVAAARHSIHAISWIREHSPTTRPPEYVERGFMYDTRTDTAEWGPRRGEPGYDVTDAKGIRGTIDFAFVDPGALWVVDLKTGQKTDNVEQLYMQALALSRILGITTVHVGFLYSRLTKVNPPEWETLDADALDSFAGKLHRLMRTLPMAQPNIGAQCKWCEVLPADCPAFAEENAA